MLGGPERGAGRLRICERTKLVLVEIDTVACCSAGSGMAAGCWPEPPWTYRRIAGEYAYLEKRFVAELAPPWPPVPSNPPCRLQDFTTRPRVPPTPCPPRQLEGTGGSGPWGGHPVPVPRPPVPGDKLGPPTYEVHMQRVQAAHGRRGGPPPYISPPAYDGPHRTLQLRPLRAPRSPPPAPRARGAVPGGWSHTLPRAATEAKHRWPRGMSPGVSPGGPGTPRHCQTLPRAAAGRERVPGRGRGQRGSGGHVLIDATRVVVRAQYVPPPQRQQVRYARGSLGPGTPPRSPSASPGVASPSAAPSPPRERSGSPRSPWQSPGGCRAARGRPPPRRPVLYAQALREAVSRIRRHTAPDSDSDAEGSVGGSRQRLCRDPRAYSSSSSSLESTGAPPGPASPTPA
ncbi:dendrin-like [Oenanthe melanoleuca]|uniref:dendrin-like n=1 Tax=Oenanthe melanoleuca TaxID=2939378 RepID=UPI0024C10284|nr:dendrin-like [Oenanthe melanoleuca]